MKNCKQKRIVLNRRNKRLLFYSVLIAFPTLQFLFFYVITNLNSFSLAFRTYTEAADHSYQYTFGLFDNLGTAFNVIATNGDLVLNSLYLYLINLVIVSSLALFFSYYIAKRYVLSGLFRVVLFLPTIISQVVLVTLYKLILNDGFTSFMTQLGLSDYLIENGLQQGLLNGPENVQYVCVLIFNVWISFGSNVLLYTGSMSGIDPSIIESAQLDGISFFKEFVYIYVPLIWPTFVTFVVTGLTALFTSTMNLPSFYGVSQPAPFSVFGFFLYTQTMSSGLVSPFPGSVYSYSVLAAIGLIITLVMVPITLGVKKLMEKYGPSVD